MNKNSVAYLVYFDCRGTGHYYRYVLYQIGLPYQQIHLSLDGTFPQHLKNFNITLADIPCIIFEGRVIKQIYSALRYLCNKFNRRDLLGSTITQQIKISQIYSRSSKRKSNAIQTFMKHLPKIKKQPSSMKNIKLQIIKELFESPGSNQVLPIIYSETGNFLFDHLTIADFLFYENCFYFCSFFHDVCRRNMPIYFAYKNFFQRTNFYQTHKDKIQKFKFLIPEFDQSINEVIQMMCKDKAVHYQ